MKTIFIDGRVFTGCLPLQEAFSVEDGYFTSVGTTRQLLAQKAAEDTVISLEGQFVCPGFIDSHMHLLNLGKTMGQCNLSAATHSLSALKAALKKFIQQKSPDAGEWVLGWGWNQDLFSPAGDIPTRHDLDEAADDRPVCIVRCCGHLLVVNSYALKVLGIDEHTPSPEGGSIDRDESGYPTGVFRDNAMALVQSAIPAPSPEEIKRMIVSAAGLLNSKGITSCHTDDLCAIKNVPWQQVIAAYRELEAEGKLTVRVYEQSQFTTPGALREFFAAGYNTGTGSSMFKIGPLKLLGDGSLGARTAYMSTSYADAPGEKGLAIFSQQEFDELVCLAHQNGMQVAIHTIGDGILDRVLAAYRRAFDECPRTDHRSGVIHVQLTRPDQLQAMQQLGLNAYVQSIFLDYDSHIVLQRAGRQLASTSYNMKSFKALGLHASNGTDCPVERPDPMRGIQCAVTRQPLDQSLPPYRPEEALSVEEALNSYTQEGAYASFEEHFKGRICSGMAADFAVLSADPFETDSDKLSSITCLATYLGGQQVFDCNKH